jgi:hypothetical protein
VVSRKALDRAFDKVVAQALAQESKRGRPRIEDRDKPKPWTTAGMSRSSWFRRQKEAKSK